MRNIFITVMLLLFCGYFENVFATNIPSPFPPYYFSADLQAYPEVVEGETVKEWINFDYPSAATKFLDDRPYTPDDRKQITENMGINDVPASVYVKFGFTVKGINMRMSPSSATMHSGNPKFDMNQYTHIGASSPVAILHNSQDNKYYYVQAEFMRGWIPSSSIKFYDKPTFDKISSMPFLRVLKDNTTISDIEFSLGDKIPIKSKNGFGYKVLLPNGKEKFVMKTSNISFDNKKFSPKRMRKLANGLLGNPYDWGGKEGYRDCSAFVRDLWLVFGLNLPRNTSLQSGVGRQIIEKPSSKEEFYNVLSQSKPFQTLIFFRGHVILYGGMEKGDYIIYHSVNRLANDSGETKLIASVVKQKLLKEHFSDIWKRVIKITEIDASL